MICRKPEQYSPNEGTAMRIKLIITLLTMLAALE